MVGFPSLMAEIVFQCKYHISFLHSLVDTGYFHVLVIVSNAAVFSEVQMILSTLFSFPLAMFGFLDLCEMAVLTGVEMVSHCGFDLHLLDYILSTFSCICLLWENVLCSSAHF